MSLSLSVQGIVLNYLIPFPKLVFEDELLQMTRFIHGDLDICRYNTESYIDDGTVIHRACVVMRDMWLDWLIEFKR